MTRTDPRRDEQIPVSDRFTLTYAAMVLALMIVNLAGYGLIAATA
jgi:hypothetical protein